MHSPPIDDLPLHELFELDDWFVTTKDDHLRAYQRWRRMLNMPTEVRHVYMRGLWLLFPDDAPMVVKVREDVLSGLIDIHRNPLRYRTNTEHLNTWEEF